MSGKQQRMPLKLVVGALIILGVLTIVLMRPAAHDPTWWHHVGIANKSRAGKASDVTVFDEDGNAFQVHHHPDDTLDAVGSPQRPNVVKPTAAPATGAPAVHKANAKPTKRPLRQGIEYFSDYDIDAVTLSPDPALRPGEKPAFNYVDPEMHPEYSIKYVSDKPRIMVIDGLLTDNEADRIVEAASQKLFRSQVAPFRDAKNAQSQSDVRTSSQAWLTAGMEPARSVVQKLLKLTGFPQGSNEELQVLKYEKTQKYDAHNDYFDPKFYGPQPSNRAVTIFLYLSDVEEGGETQFPRADGKPPTFDFTSCTRGLRVHPVKGRVVIFYDMKPNRALDDYSLHGGCPVKRGIKWGGTLWLRVPTP